MRLPLQDVGQRLSLVDRAELVEQRDSFTRSSHGNAAILIGQGGKIVR